MEVQVVPLDRVIILRKYTRRENESKRTQMRNAIGDGQRMNGMQMKEKERMKGKK